MAKENYHLVTGHVDLKSFGNWYLDCDFEVHPNPWSGFELLYEVDKQRYSTITEIAIARNIPTDLVDFLEDRFNYLEQKVYAAHRISPGKILPWHIDGYKKYCETRNITDLNQITRTIIFVEDWQPGHGLQVGFETVPTWTQGDWISWQGGTPHLVLNLGQVNRYTLQITGIRNDHSS